MDILSEDLHFIKAGETWAIVGDNNSRCTDLLHRITGKKVEYVGFKHQFRNLSNTSDFYYQQRYNSADSEDAQTVHELLNAQKLFSENGWTYGRVVRELNLEDLLSEQVIKLSNGETKRMLIAAALIKNPSVLLLDHPLTGLDKNTRERFSALLEKIVASGIMVIIAAEPDELPGAITHVAVLEKDRIVFHGEKHLFSPVGFNLTYDIRIDEHLLKKLLASQPVCEFQTIIKMTNVSVEYDGRKILSNINWHVRQGERWSLSGPNGAGKSTLLSLVNADNPQAYANQIILFDRKRGSGESIWDIKKQTGFVSPELYQYFPTDSSCLHVIESGFYDTIGLFRPTDPLKEAVCMEWMKLMQLEQFAGKLFNMIPADAQRLCLLARALVKNPALLILDEPTQGLDGSQQRFFSSLVDRICNMSSVTLIYVSHYEHHIPKAVNRYYRLENGCQVV